MKADLPQKLLKKSLDKRRARPFQNAACANFAKEKSESTWGWNVRQIKWIVVHKNTALQEYQFRHGKRVQDRRTWEQEQSLCHHWWGWLPLYEYEIEDGCYFFLRQAERRRDLWLSSLYLRNRSLFTNQSVERIKKCKLWILVILVAEEKAKSSTNNVWDGGTSKEATALARCTECRKSGAPCLTPMRNGKDWASQTSDAHD